MAKGPNFALTKTIDANCLKEVEVNYERFCYGYRWKLHIQRKPSVTVTEDIPLDLSSLFGSDDAEDIEFRGFHSSLSLPVVNQATPDPEPSVDPLPDGPQMKPLHIPTPHVWKAQPYNLRSDLEEEIKDVKMWSCHPIRITSRRNSIQQK